MKNWTVAERQDPDETEGRRLYRTLADSEAFVEAWLAGCRKQVRMKP